MVVDYVITNNMDLLENGFKTGILESKEITKDFEKNFPILLSHISISYIVTDISILEAVYLKYFANGNLIDVSTYINVNNFDRKLYPSTAQATQSLFTLNANIENDEDIEIKPGIMYFPAKTVYKTVVVKFTGSNILNVIGDITRTSSIFNVLYSNMQASPEKTKKEIFDNILIKSFVDEFYKYMGFKLAYTDLLTDSLLTFNYLKPAEESGKIVSLDHVNSIYGEIPFVKIDADTYKNSLANIASNKLTVKKQVNYNTFNLETTDIYLTCNTTFYSFLETVLYLPLENILENVDNKILYLSHSVVIPDGMKKYQNRLSTIMKKIIAEKESLKTSQSIDKYNLTMLNTRVQFTLKFNLKNISDVIVPWEENIKNNLYGNTSNFITAELLQMISEIRKYATAAYSTINK